MNRKKLIINFYLTYKCNLSCTYCEVFDNDFIQYGDENLFFSQPFETFIEYFSWYDIDIEFFWGEPLLKGAFMKRFYEYYKDRFWYKITTNGLLLDDTFGFLDKILMSVHSDAIEGLTKKILSWAYEKYKSKVEFTYVIDRDNIDLLYPFSEVLMSRWYKKINILPVFWKYNWTKDDLKSVLRLVSYLRAEWFELDFMWYENNKNDLEFSLDIDGNITAFTWEYIYNDLLREKFGVSNISQFDDSKYTTLMRKFDTINGLSDLDNAKICNVYGWQSSENFLLLNKFLISLKYSKW